MLSYKFKAWKWIPVIAMLALPVAVQAAPDFITYEGYILDKTTGLPVHNVATNFKFQIKDSFGCVLWDENHTITPISGNFSAKVGKGTYNFQGAASFPDIFTKISGINGNSCSPSGLSNPRVLEVSVFDSGSYQSIGTFSLGGAVHAFTADSANSLSGYSSNQVLKFSSPTNTGELSQADFDELFDLIMGTSNRFVKNNTNGGASLPSYSGNPASPAAGQVWYDSTAGALKYRDGSSAQTLLKSTDIISFSQLQSCGSNQILQMDATGTSWSCQNLTSSGLSTTLNDSQIYVGNGSNVATAVSISKDATLSNSGQLTVTGLQGNSVSSATPNPNDVLTYSGGQWVPQQIPAAPVESVAGKTGAVVLNSADIADADSASGSNTIVKRDASGNFQANGIGVSGLTATNITSTNVISTNVSTENLEIGNNTNGKVVLKTHPNPFANYNLMLPDNDGDSGQVLTTDGNGLTYWSTPSSGGVTSFNGRSGAVVSQANDYTWAQIDKSTSSLADIATRSASDLNLGTLDDARLSSNVVKKNESNAFSVGNQTIQISNPADSGLIIRGNASQTGSLLKVEDFASNPLYTLNPSGSPVNNTDLITKQYTDDLMNDLLKLPYAPSSGENGKSVRWNGGSWEYYTPSDGTGTVASVGISAPSNLFQVSGSPITTSGTLNLTYANQTQNKVFASPDGAAGDPQFRSLVENDLPNISANKITGTLNEVQMPAFSGDIETAPGSTVAAVKKINGYPVNLSTAPTAGQVLKFAGTQWIAQDDNADDPTKLPLAGGTMTGYITLHDEPQNPGHAATKNYVDNKVNAGFENALQLSSLPGVSQNGQSVRWNNTLSQWEYYDPSSLGGAGDVLNGGNSFNSNMNLGTKDNYSLSLLTNDTKRINITNDGRVGIGNNLNPNHKFHFHEQRNASGDLTASAVFSAEVNQQADTAGIIDGSIPMALGVNFLNMYDRGTYPNSDGQLTVSTGLGVNSVVVVPSGIANEDGGQVGINAQVIRGSNSTDQGKFNTIIAGRFVPKHENAGYNPETERMVGVAVEPLIKSGQVNEGLGVAVEGPIVTSGNLKKWMGIYIDAPKHSKSGPVYSPIDGAFGIYQSGNSLSNSFEGDIFAHKDINVRGALRIGDSPANGVVELRTQGFFSPYTLYLPTNPGSPGQFLQLDTGGQLQWAPAVNGSNLNAPNSFVQRDGGGGFSAGVVDLKQLRLQNGDDTYQVGIRAPTGLANSYVITLPNSPPSGPAGKSLVDADGSGNMEWRSVALDGGNEHPLTLGTNVSGNFNLKAGNQTRMTILGSSGFIGIGTISPTSTLNVAKTFTSSGGGTERMIRNEAEILVAGSSTNYIANENVVTTGASTGTIQSITGTKSEAFTTSTVSTNYSYGVHGQSTNTGSGTVLSANGVYGVAINSGSGSISNGFGVRGTASSSAGSLATGAGGDFLASVESSGSMNNAIGVKGAVTLANGTTINMANAIVANVTNNNTGTITNAKGVDASVNRPIGSIANGYGVHVGAVQATNAYGLYIGTLTGTNKWSVYASDSNSPSAFAGAMSIGHTNVPFGLLDIRGKTGQDALVSIDGEGPNTGLVISRYNSTTAPPSITLIKQTGTMTSPGNITSTDKYGMIDFGSSYNSGAYRSAARIEASAVSTPSSSTMPGKLSFLTTQDGMTTPSEKMVIDHNGNVGIGNSAPTYKLDVAGQGYFSGGIRIGSSQTITGSDNVNVSAGTGYTLKLSSGSTEMTFGNTGIKVGVATAVSRYKNDGICEFASSNPSLTSASGAFFVISSCSGVQAGAVVSCSPSLEPTDATCTWNAMAPSNGNIRIGISRTSSETGACFSAAPTWKCRVTW